MLFHSAGFLLVFLPLFLLLAHFLPTGKTRAWLLLVFSYLFYSGAEPIFVLLLLFSSLTDFYVALRLSATQIRKQKIAWLLVSLAVNLGLLGFYKYGGWISASFALGNADFFQSYVLPAGISFYTFQSMAYTIDVYRGKIEPETSLLSFCNYIAYLPQLIAGPIERFHHLAPQLEKFRAGTSTPQWTAGIDRIMLGIAQKLILADGCGYIVDRLVQGQANDFFSAWAVGIGFGLQIYFDFAAYSHMAIGISLLLGIRLNENFLAPYQADSIQEFWRRWHITLSSWFRDYLYIPLGGSQKGILRTIFNVFITFTLCGLWHGAGFNFLLWGFLHGAMLGLYHFKQLLIPGINLPKTIAIPVTFLAVSFAWVPFRLSNWQEISEVWQGMLGLNGMSERQVSIVDLAILAALVFMCILIPHAAKRWPGASGWQESAVLAVLAAFAMINSPAITQFIYFQF
jgi:alginate O-acetyltransferase complex protein AlgI